MKLYSNFKKGTLTNSPGAAGTSFQSAEFANLPVVASPDVLTLVLDPLEETGAPEVLEVTAHTSASTTCTVVRARDGSAARNAVAGMRWIATPTVRDWNNVASPPPYLRLRKGTGQNLTDGTAASITFGTVEANLPSVLGTFDIVSTSLWSPPVDGIYAVNYMGAFAGSTTNAGHINGVTRRILAILNNTDTVNLDLQASAPSIPANVDTNVLLSGEIELLASKDYAFRARQDSGATRSFEGNTNATVRYVRPLN